MAEWPFTLITAEDPEPHLEALVTATDGAAVSAGTSGHRFVVDFVVNAPTYRQALSEALTAVEVTCGLTVIAVEDPPEEVGLQEIADRAGLSREAVAKWSRDELQSADRPFPRPLTDATWGKRWWWPEISNWMAAYTGWSPDEDQVVQFNSAVNGLLRARRIDPIGWRELLPGPDAFAG